MYMINKLILPKYDRCTCYYWRLFIDSLKHSLFSLFQFLPKCQALNRKRFEIRIQKYLFWTIFGPVSKVTNWKRIWESPLLLCIFICWERVSQKSRNCTSACYIVWIAYSSLFWQGKKFYLFQYSRFCWVTETTRICVLASQSTCFSENEYGLQQRRTEIL